MTKKINFYAERPFFSNCTNLKQGQESFGNSWKAITDNLNFQDKFKVDASAIRNCYGVIKAHFEVKKEEKRASGINPEVTHLDPIPEELIEQ